MFCQKCGASVPEKASFCPTCGAIAPAQTDAPQAHSAPIGASQTYQPITPPTQNHMGSNAAPPSPPPKQGNRKTITIALGIIALLLVIVLVIAAFTRCGGTGAISSSFNPFLSTTSFSVGSASSKSPASSVSVISSSPAHNLPEPEETWIATALPSGPYIAAEPSDKTSLEGVWFGFPAYFLPSTFTDPNYLLSFTFDSSGKVVVGDGYMYSEGILSYAGTYTLSAGGTLEAKLMEQPPLGYDESPWPLAHCTVKYQLEWPAAGRDTLIITLLFCETDDTDTAAFFSSFQNAPIPYTHPDWYS